MSLRMNSVFESYSDMCKKMNVEEDLIEHVRYYNVLYDPGNKEYRNHVARKEAWEEIGAKMEMSPDDCKEMWKKLRNAYGNARNRRKPKPGEAVAKYIGKWKFEDQMAFLETTLMEQRQTLDTSQEFCCEMEEERENLLEVDSVLSDMSNSTANPPTATIDHHSFMPTLSYSVPKKRTCFDSSVDTLVKMMQADKCRQDASQGGGRSHYPKDGTDMFFLSLAQDVKKLSRLEQAKLKMEISNMVFKAEIRDAQKCATE